MDEPGTRNESKTFTGNVVVYVKKRKKKQSPAIGKIEYLYG